MKIRSVAHNNRKKAFEVKTSTKKLVFPFAKAEPTLTIQDPVATVTPSAPASSRPSTRILVADADGDMRATYRHALAAMGDGYELQWDDFECENGCGTFQYRQSTRKLTRLS